MLHTLYNDQREEKDGASLCIPIKSKKEKKDLHFLVGFWFDFYVYYIGIEILRLGLKKNAIVVSFVN